MTRAAPSPTTDDLARLYTVDEVAQRFQVGATTIWKLIRDGELPSVKVGRLRRIPARAVLAYLDAGGSA